MSDRLRDRLVERIRAHGLLTFAQYMEAALYDPAEGFFARHPVGEERHFVTSPHVSPVFARLLAAQVRDAWEALGQPAAFTVLELGAGDGTLARGIRSALPDVAMRYVGIDRSAGARAALTEADVEAVASLADLAEPVEGIVLANELFDNVGFHLARGRGGRTVEVLIGADEDGALVELEAPPTVEVPPVPDGVERPVGVDARAIVREVARTLARGYALVIDYGFAGDEEPEPVRGYASHRLVRDLLADPGSSDITGPVDFDDLAREAREAGLQAWGPVRQREALLALGYQAELRALRAEQAAREEAGDWRRAIGAFGARGEASMLVDPAELGSLKVLALGTAGLPEPRATRGS